jgi:hypothetical protein
VPGWTAPALKKHKKAYKNSCENLRNKLFFTVIFLPGSKWNAVSASTGLIACQSVLGDRITGNAVKQEEQNSTEFCDSPTSAGFCAPANPLRRGIGILLLILSFVLYPGILVISGLSISAETKVKLTALTVITAELCFWTGGLILGRELVRKYRDHLDPRKWLRR